MYCRFCHNPLNDVFIDLGNAPASNSFLNHQALDEPEVFYPLKVYTCPECFLVQINEYKKSDAIFDNNYVYFSSYSKSWLEHARKYTDMAAERFSLTSRHHVVELASNDGYLLQYFVRRGIPVLGIEPTANTAEVARKKGIESITRFFGRALATELAAEGRGADLIIGNNVLAHVPDILDFVGGIKILLSKGGAVTMEFPHLMQLVDNNQFDTIYHEHFSYLSLLTVQRIFASQGLEIFDVEQLPTHGGSLRIFAKHQGDEAHPTCPGVAAVLGEELSRGMNQMGYYRGFQQRCLEVKLEFTDFLLHQKKAGRQVAAYGAAAKGNTLLAYCGIKNDLIEYVVDANPHKQGMWLPASHIPVVDEAELRRTKPQFLILFAWNLKEELIRQLSYISEWGGVFVVPIPHLELIAPTTATSPAAPQHNPGREILANLS